MKNYSNLIKKYYEGETTLEEEQKLARWLMTDAPEEYSALAQEFAYFEEYKNLRYKKRTTVRWAQVATFLLVFFTSAILIMQNSKTVYLTENETKSVTLPDGSELVLNRNTKVTLDEKFNDANRMLVLEGQAFFSVKKGSVPFIVSFNQSRITVLGTKFSVNSKESHVYVQEGEVKLTSEGKETVNITNGKELINSDLIKPTIRYSENPNVISWVNKKLKFNRRALMDVIKDVERHFGITIKVGNKKIPDEYFTGNFYASDLETVLKSICSVFNYSYKINKNKSSVSLFT